MVDVYAMQGLHVTVESLFVVKLLEVDLAQRAISTCRLEKVVVTLEQIKRMTGKGEWQVLILVQPITMLNEKQIIGIVALLGYQRIIVKKHRGHRLQVVCLEVSHRVTTADDVGPE